MSNLLSDDMYELDLLKLEMTEAQADEAVARTTVTTTRSESEAKEPNITKLKLLLEGTKDKYQKALDETRVRYKAAAKATSQRLHRNPSHLLTLPASNQQSLHLSQMKNSDPDKLSGGMTDYSRWKFECRNVIAVRSKIDMDDKRIMGSRMEGLAGFSSKKRFRGTRLLK
ncbi:hypothetical protein SeLEV6574_g05141 [Synchytrium endobioticum]|uniref:Uncharacterized protein n=1 Tax=Synchytrium endobioticum TaxID=286115 RepID=A0A507CVQ8_9FUNG|nr:hypothetical protein SeLEV6574_g05141 [Synchytrium endobioticum]